MAFLAGLLALGSRFAGKILTTALGWASTLLFGRVPASRQYLLLGITFGSVIWLVLVGGVLFPDVGTFLLLLVPGQELVPEAVVRALMLIGACVVPAAVGTLTLLLTDADDRGARRIATAVVRGYPLTILLAVLLLFLAALAVFRKGRSLLRGWTDAHVPVVILPGRYDEVADDLDRALEAAGLELVPTEAPAAMSKPARWLAAVAGAGAGSLIPERMLQLDGQDLDILIYPMDLLISGRPELVARARAAMASRLATSAAYLTVSEESQAIEDELAALAGRPRHGDRRPAAFDDAAVAAFTEIDQRLATLEVPYEEWEVLFRQRLQVERDLRAGALEGEAVIGGTTPGREGPLAALRDVGRLVAAGAGMVLDAAADERTGAVVDRIAGTDWRWAARAASIAAVAAREVVRTRDDAEAEAEESAAEAAAYATDPDGAPGAAQERSATA